MRNVVFRDSKYKAKKDVEVHYAENVTFENVTVNGVEL